MNHNYRLYKRFRQQRLLSMLGTTSIPTGHLAFDHARIDPISANWNLFAAVLPNHRLEPLIEARTIAWVAFR